MDELYLFEVRGLSDEGHLVCCTEVKVVGFARTVVTHGGSALTPATPAAMLTGITEKPRAVQASTNFFWFASLSKIATEQSPPPAPDGFAAPP